MNRVLLFLNIPIYRQKDSYSADFVNLLDFFLSSDSLGKEIKIVTPVGEGKGSVPLTIPPNVSILELPYYSSPFELIKISWKFIPRILNISLSKLTKESDVIGIVAPGTIFYFSFPIIRFIHKKPIFLIVRGHKIKTVQYEYRRYPLRRIMATLVISIYDILVKLALKRNKIIMFFIGNKEMAEKYGSKTKIYNLSPMIPKDLIRRQTNMVEIGKKTKILYLGRLSGEKGIYDLLSAYSQLIKEKRSLLLHIVGSGPEEVFLKNRAIRLNLRNHIIFHGFIPRGDRLWNIVDSSDIFVLPSYTEGMPRAVFEVMARGVPVICTRVGGLSKVIKDGVNGLLVQSGDVIGLKKAMIKLIDNLDLRNRLTYEGYKTVAQFTFEKQGKMMTKIIEQKLFENDPSSIERWG